MVIREYNTGDLSEIYRLFYETVHSVNLKDYTRAQADAWAPFDYDREKWNNSLIENYCVVASENNTCLLYTSSGKFSVGWTIIMIVVTLAVSLWKGLKDESDKNSRKW